MRSNVHILQPRADLFTRRYRIGTGTLRARIEAVTKRAAARGIDRISTQATGDCVTVTFARSKRPDPYRAWA